MVVLASDTAPHSASRSDRELEVVVIFASGPGLANVPSSLATAPGGLVTESVNIFRPDELQHQVETA